MTAAFLRALMFDALLVLRYTWAFFPGTLLGLLLVPLTLIGLVRCQVIRGCLEVHGGPVSWFLRRGLPWIGGHGGSAMTLGHVIIGRDEACLARSRDHEHVHVRQYERWGPFFLPAYLATSVWQALRGRHAYFDNPFEREAFDEIDRRRCR